MMRWVYSADCAWSIWVCDWADSPIRQAKSVETTPTLRESVNQWQDIENQKARIEERQPVSTNPGHT